MAELKTYSKNSNQHKGKSKSSTSKAGAASVNSENLSSTSPLPLTAKEKAVLEFIEVSLGGSGICPSYQEIKEHFGFASFNSVQNYLKQLSQKGYVQAASNQKRAIQILHSASALQDHFKSSTGSSPQPLLQSKEGVLSLPFLGKVAAGRPLEALAHDEFVDVPSALVREARKSFALKVQGNSMIDEGILDGDTILIQQQSHAKNGDLVVATIDNEATVKRFYLHSPSRGSNNEVQVELRPSNETMPSMWYSPFEVNIQGVVVGLVRKF